MKEGVNVVKIAITEVLGMAGLGFFLYQVLVRDVPVGDWSNVLALIVFVGMNILTVREVISNK